MRTFVLALSVSVASTVSLDGVADLMQKGIYSQETLGDLDTAIRIYRQIGSMAKSKGLRTYAAQAQLLLAECLMRKGLVKEAREALTSLFRDYAEQKDVVIRGTQMQRALRRAEAQQARRSSSR